MIQLLGFNLPGRHWIVLNRLRTGHGRTGLVLHRRGSRPTPHCDCGHQTQSSRRIVDECLFRSFPRGLTELNKDITDIITWLEELDIYILSPYSSTYVANLDYNAIIICRNTN